jgi:serine/threonine protein kinase
LPSFASLPKIEAANGGRTVFASTLRRSLTMLNALPSRKAQQLIADALLQPPGDRYRCLVESCPDRALRADVWSLLEQAIHLHVEIDINTVPDIKGLHPRDVEVPQSGRDAFIEGASSADPSLRRSVESMLDLLADAERDSFCKGWSSERLIAALHQVDHYDPASLRVIMRELDTRGVFRAGLNALSSSGEATQAGTPRRLGQIRGWLLVFLVLMALGSAATGFIGVWALALKEWRTATFGLLVGGYGLFAVASLFRHQPAARRHASLWLTAWIAVFAIPIVRSPALAGKIGSYLPILFPALWLMYLRRSTRVAAIFRGASTTTERPRKRPYLPHIRGSVLVFLVVCLSVSVFCAFAAIRWLAFGTWAVTAKLGTLSVYGIFCGYVLLLKRPHARDHARLWSVLLVIISVSSMILDLLFVRIGVIDGDMFYVAAFGLTSLVYVIRSKRMAQTFGALSFFHDAYRSSPRIRTGLDGLHRHARIDAQKPSPVIDDRQAVEAADSTPVGASAWPPSMFGAYRTLRLLGVGGMGSVYLAEQANPRRQVALKVMNDGLIDDQALRRFRLEADLLGRLQHPGIAHIFQADSLITAAGERPFFAMEYIDGPPILEYARAGGLNTRACLELMIKLCDAVDHAHRRGIVHRDLKPHNILVDKHGQPKILDFGIAHVIERDQRSNFATRVGQIIGTLAYMSPEQLLADPALIDRRSDVYSLGVILYELLSGHLPHDGDPRQWRQTAMAILEEVPLPLGAHDKRYRGDVETIVAKALEKSPERRYSSAVDLAADLRRHLDDHPIDARRSSLIYRARKFTRRNRVFAISTAVVVAVTVAAWHDTRLRSTEIVFRDAGSLDLVSVTPVPEWPVSEESVVEAEVRFKVESFEQDKFMIHPQVDQVDRLGGISRLVSSPTPWPMLHTASGTQHVTVPLRLIWNNADVARPYGIRFVLLQRCGTSGFCNVVAMTRTLHYPVRSNNVVDDANGPSDSSPRPTAGPTSSASDAPRANIFVNSTKRMVFFNIANPTTFRFNVSAPVGGTVLQLQRCMDGCARSESIRKWQTDTAVSVSWNLPAGTYFMSSRSPNQSGGGDSDSVVSSEYRNETLFTRFTSGVQIAFAIDRSQ